MICIKMLCWILFSHLLVASVAQSPQQIEDITELPEESDQCAMLNQVQSVVIQLLSGHFEFSKNLQVLTVTSDGLQQDVNDLKGLYRHVNATQREMFRLFSSLVGEELDPMDNTSLPTTSQALQTLKDNLNFHALSSGNESATRGSPGYILQLSKQLDDQKARLEYVEKQNKRLLRKYSEANSKLARLEKRVKNVTAESTSVEHFFSNQKEINGKLLNSIRYLEENMQKMTQSDSPYLQPSGCPQSFVRNFMSCYFFVNDTMNWIDAEKFCQSYDQNSHLVGLETVDEEDFLVKFRNYNQVNWSSMYIWTGGNDMGKESEWNWVSTGKAMGYRNWRPNQPDSHNNEWQNCVYLRTDGLDHRWDDWHCHAAKLNFVCEIQLKA